MNLNVLYEDNHLIAVYKPSGVLTQGDETCDVSMMDEVKKYLKEKYRKPGNVFLGLLHRLDRPVSGIVLFSKTSKGASRLSEQFRNHTVEKKYHAIALGRPKADRGELINYMGKDRESKRAIIYKTEVEERCRPSSSSAFSQSENLIKEGSQKAELSYEVVALNDKYCLLLIQPRTGRFHQIRAQLSFAGFPVLGDLKYGAPSPLPDRSIALSATYLSFKLATKNERREISVPIPAGWDKYVK
ncbi:MAG: RluA family pseudouridine synthase [Candidatus Wildermuthbacteria bacterium]|nr:RluA family pseudouridine synthase [Candidatus Wildermuthbacteria bacterium]